MTTNNKNYTINIALSGASGRMGQMIAHCLDESDIFTLSAATAGPRSKMIGQKLNGITISSDPQSLALGHGAVIIDFTRPAATMTHIDIALASKTAMVIGTTGLSDEQENRLKTAATEIPIIYCANTSMGVTILAQIVEQIASLLDQSWDIEIMETHHNQKIDAPSGTALALGRAAAKGRQIDLDNGRKGDGRTGKRQIGDIGFAALRGGDVAGEHSVVFFGQQERIEITHRANSRLIFGKGALKAAEFIAQQPAGLYRMDDVLKG